MEFLDVGQREHRRELVERPHMLKFTTELESEVVHRARGEGPRIGKEGVRQESSVAQSDRFEVEESKAGNLKEG